MTDFAKYDKEERADGTILLTPKKEDLDWEPTSSDRGYVIQGGGKVSQLHGDAYARECGIHHNTFKTESQAEKAAKLQRVSHAVIRACLLVDPEFEPHWGGISFNKHGVFYSHTSKSWTAGDNMATDSHPAYVSTTEKAKQVCALLAKWKVVPC